MIEHGPRLISREDQDVSQAVADFLKEEGIDVRVDSKMIGVEKQGNSIAEKIESTGRVSQIAGTHMLVATGRRPNTDDLGPRQGGYRYGRARVYPGRRPVAFPVFGRWVIAMVEARSRTRRGMISRSWQRIFSTTIKDA